MLDIKPPIQQRAKDLREYLDENRLSLKSLVDYIPELESYSSVNNALRLARRGQDQAISKERLDLLETRAIELVGEKNLQTHKA